MNREYVIICNRHDSYLKGALLFWGYYTPDDAKRRSFGGYTNDYCKCEKYTREELENFRGSNKDNYPFFDEIKVTRAKDLEKYPDVFCTMDDLINIGYSVRSIVMRF